MRSHLVVALAALACGSVAGSARADGTASDAVTLAQAQPPPASQPSPSQPPPPGYGAPPPGYGPPPQGYYPPPGYGPPPGYPPPYYYPPPGYYAPPQPAMPPPPPKERFSTGMMVGGIVLAGLGVVGLFAGAAVYTEANRDEDVLSPCAVNVDGTSSCPSPPNRDDEKATGVGLMIAGGVGIAVGVPLLIIGARKVPVDKGAPAEPAKQPAVEASLRLSPRGGALRFAF